MRGALAIALVSFAGAAAFAEADDVTFKSGNHYTVRFPDGWRRIDDTTVTQAAQALRRMAGVSMPTSEAAFERADSTQPFEYPYVLVQFHPGNTSGAYRDIERQLEQGVEQATSKAGALGNLMSELNFDRPVVDRRRNRVLMTMRSHVAGIGPIRGFMAMHLGKDGAAQVMLYAHESEAESYKADFAAISDSVRFESGYEFGAGGIFDGILGKALLGGIIGAALALLAALTKRGTGRKKVVLSPYPASAPNGAWGSNGALTPNRVSAPNGASAPMGASASAESDFEKMWGSSAPRRTPVPATYPGALPTSSPATDTARR